MQIAIIGCGPAGLAAALLLERKAHRVTLLERFASPAPVGSGLLLQPTGLAVLRALGLGDAFDTLGSRIERIRGISSPAGRVVLDVNYQVLGQDVHGLAVHRAALFDVLYGEVLEQGIVVRTKADIRRMEIDGDEASLFDTAGNAYGPFDLVVDASGAGCTLRAHAALAPRRRELAWGAIWGSFDWPGGSFDAHTLEQRYVNAHTMVGVLPMGRHAAARCEQVAFFWSLKTGSYPEWLASGLDEWKSRVRAIWPETESILEQIVEPGQMTLARYGHATLPKPYGQRIAYIGDAAHSTSPQLGQGANMALLDAWSLAEALSECAEPDSSLEIYAAARRRHVRSFQLASLLLTPFYQSDSRILATLRDVMFDPVSRMPMARRIVAGLISGLLASPPKGLRYKQAAVGAAASRE